MIPVQEDIYFFVNMMNDAYGKKDNNIKLLAQNYIHHFRDTNLIELFNRISAIIPNTIWSYHTRTSACKLASDCITFKNQQGQYLWDTLSLEYQESFKEKILYFFTNPGSQPVEGIDLIVGAIAEIEFPRNEWKEIVNTLINYCYNSVHPSTSYYILTQILKTSSSYLGDYEDHFVKLTEAHLKLKSELSLFNLDMWRQFAEYFDTKFFQKVKVEQPEMPFYNFLQSAGQKLLQSMIDCLLIEEDTISQGKDIKMTAFETIKALVKVCDDNVINQIMSMFEQTFNSASINSKQNGILLHATIGLFPNKKLLHKLLQKNYGGILEVLNEESQVSVEKSLQALVYLAEGSPQIFLEIQGIEKLVTKLLEFTQKGRKMKFLAIKVLSCLSHGLPNQSNKTISLFKGCIELFKKEISKLMKQDKQVSENLLLIVINWLISSNSFNQIQQVIQLTIQQATNLMQEQTAKSLLLSQNLYQVIRTGFLSLRHWKKSMKVQKMVALIDLSISVQIPSKQIFGLIGISALSFGEDFQKHSAKYFYLISEGCKSSDLKTFQAAVICISDLISQQYKLYARNEKIVSLLLNSCKTTQCYKVKKLILSAFSQFSFFIEAYLITYSDEVLSMFSDIMNFVLQIIKNKNKIEALEELNLEIVGSLQSIMFSLNQNQRDKKMMQHFDVMTKFLFTTGSKEQNPTIEYLVQVLFLIHDFIGFYNTPYQQNIGMVAKCSELKEMIERVAKYKERKDVKDLLSFIQARSCL